MDGRGTLRAEATLGAGYWGAINGRPISRSDFVLRADGQCNRRQKRVGIAAGLRRRAGCVRPQRTDRDRRGARRAAVDHRAEWRSSRRPRRKVAGRAIRQVERRFRTASGGCSGLPCIRHLRPITSSTSTILFRERRRTTGSPGSPPTQTWRDRAAREVILDLNSLSTRTNHNGGGLHFGPDGKLYVGVGENAELSTPSRWTIASAKSSASIRMAPSPLTIPPSFQGSQAGPRAPIAQSGPSVCAIPTPSPSSGTAAPCSSTMSGSRPGRR